jgi:dTDP-4-dehydrorhamnose 3,5-epimerase
LSALHPHGPIVLRQSSVRRDDRGTFRELWRSAEYAAAGIPELFVQDNCSSSARGVLRGLHFQYDRPQGKLVSVLTGRIFDVAVDIRPASPGFRSWMAVELTAGEGNQLYIPPGFAHGFLALEDSIVLYKCTEYYHAGSDAAVRWNDPAIGIEWPETSPVLSPKDAAAPLLSQLDTARLSLAP